MSLQTVLRADLRDFAGYRSARSEAAVGDCFLDANEAAGNSLADASGALRRYPDPQPPALREALARLYGCTPAALLATRGSDEAIDLLVRAACPPGAGAVVVAPPVFGMYAVCARLHGARVVEVPLRDDGREFGADLDAMGTAALDAAASLVFLCAPGNPAGGVPDASAVVGLARRLDGHALVAVDEAYIEFADAPSLLRAVAGRPGSAAWPTNLVVLRTLSKAHALAGARIGAVAGDPVLVAALQRCQAPYPLSRPAVERALAALAPAALAATVARIDATRVTRSRLAAALARCPGVRRVHPAQANFLLVRFDDAGAALRRLRTAGIVVRDMRAHAALQDALRITIGDDAQAATVLRALGEAA